MTADSVDVYASQPHYADHLLPILRALPDELQGTVYAPRELRGQIDGPVIWSTPPNSTMPLLVAGFQDLRYARRSKVLVNHGAGQRYIGIDSPSYAGGPGRESVDLFICPNEQTAALERARYPHARAVAVGCPKLDAWRQVPKPHNPEPVVAVTFHWNSHIGVAEGGWAWPTWRATIEQLAKRVPLLGHCHPRARIELAPWWRSIGVEYVPRAVDLLERADVLVLDNSSIGFEWAACDRPTVWLGSKDWRDWTTDPDARHGLRFGDDLPGPDLGACLTDDAASVADALRDVALGQLGLSNNANAWRSRRWTVADRVYGPNDQCASHRAADAILDLIEAGPGVRMYTKPRPCNC